MSKTSSSSSSSSSSSATTVVAVKNVIHKLQLCLLDGIKSEAQLLLAASLLSKPDYHDVVTERSIAQVCGYPLCTNSLPSTSPSEPPKKGRYRISLKEHKVYDLFETRMYCSTKCVVDSRAYAESLQNERSLDLDRGKVDKVMRMFEGLSLEGEMGLGEKGDYGLGELSIKEKEDANVGVVSMEEWVGPSNAIEGYIPQHGRNKPGSKLKDSKLKKEEKNIFNEMDFMSTIITQEDGYSISKNPSSQTKKKRNHKGANDSLIISGGSSSDSHNAPESRSNDEKSEIITNHNPMISEAHPSCSVLKSSLKSSRTTRTNRSVTWADEKTEGADNKTLSELETISGGSSSDSHNAPESRSNDEKSEIITNHNPMISEAHPSYSVLKSSLKSSWTTRTNRSVTWADEKTEGADNKTLSELETIENRNEIKNENDNEKHTSFHIMDESIDDVDHAYRLASAEACAEALSKAAEAVASGESDVPDAVSEAGLVILPPPVDNIETESEGAVDPEPARLKWPQKTGITESDFFDSEDSWFDSPPEEFVLELSPFATMFMSLFAWVSSSTLAYVYGRDDSFHEDYASINGREYPRKIVALDGRSSEIKQTLAGCLSRALPGLVHNLRLPTPVSTIEYGMGCLLETMSFLDPLPGLRMKQWQVFVLLFVEALSVSLFPAIAPHLTNRRSFFQKVFDDGRISREEYELLKDVMLPLGRVPQFATQSGA